MGKGMGKDRQENVERKKTSKGMDGGTRGFALLGNLSCHMPFISFECRLVKEGSVARE